MFVSAVTAREIAIKKGLGKLQAPGDFEAAIASSHFRELPVTIQHAWTVGTLPRHHDDPFDRLLVAQAQSENLTLLTSDQWPQAYGSAVRLVAR